MFIARRLLSLLIASGLLFLLFTTLRSSSLKQSWEHIPQLVGLGENYPTKEQIASGENILPDLRASRPRPAEHKDVFPAGVPKPQGSNYTRTLVIPYQKNEKIAWIEKELGDLLALDGLLSTALYAVDDVEAPLHTSKNKGHEVMVYLTYIIEHYEDLADISMFMHSHRWAWHNNELLDQDAAAMVRYLFPERVIREGYMNMRCHWDPGCPDWLHPGAVTINGRKKEEKIFAEYWGQVFPLDPIPAVLAQPCCAQFAVSRDRIRALPRSRYIELRDWLLRTELSDYLSGRFFEYTWQYIFTGNSVECPAMHICYCDGYGFCFGGASKFNDWFELRYRWREYKRELKQWQAKKVALDNARADGTLAETSDLDIPAVGRDEFLEGEIAAMNVEIQRTRDDAFIRGRMANVRAQEAGRPWKESDVS